MRNYVYFLDYWASYIHKYVYFSATIQNHLVCLTQFKHHLNDLNAEQG